ncbi:MAG: cysteine--tRNA ligase, partial [Thiobacillus sp.]|nr:cysteine--tRNA ligase [Thiobacillus sp.]
SKSLGNFFTIREVLKKYRAEEVRFFILRAHYRSPLNYSDAHLDDAKGALARLYTALKQTPVEVASPDWSQPAALRFRAAMDDDFNTPEAIAVLFELASDANRGDAAAATLLRSLGGVLGLLQREARDFLQDKSSSVQESVSASELLTSETTFSETGIELRIEARAAAKNSRNFAEADRIRAELAEAGIVLEDGVGGTTWRRA